jgi:hypothetical protein
MTIQSSRINDVDPEAHMIARTDQRRGGEDAEDTEDDLVGYVGRARSMRGRRSQQQTKKEPQGG